MNDKSKMYERLALSSTMLTVALAVGSSCSTLGEPIDQGPPVCEFCEPGEQELRCRIALYQDDVFFGGVGDSAWICLEPDATDEQKQQACIDSCEERIAGNAVGLECQFTDEAQPFYWTGCIPPQGGGSGDTGAGAGPGEECPDWYVPAARIHADGVGASVATVTIERSLIDDLGADPFAIYRCDGGRYIEHEDHWEFEQVLAGELLYALGIRTGDRNAVVQGVDPRTHEVATPVFVLDSIEQMHGAYDALATHSVLRVAVDRPEAETGVWVVQVVIK